VVDGIDIQEGGTGMGGIVLPAVVDAFEGSMRSESSWYVDNRKPMIGAASRRISAVDA
jgi:hypothetical protein